MTSLIHACALDSSSKLTPWSVSMYTRIVGAFFAPTISSDTISTPRPSARASSTSSSDCSLLLSTRPGLSPRRCDRFPFIQKESGTCPLSSYESYGRLELPLEQEASYHTTCPNTRAPPLTRTPSPQFHLSVWSGIFTWPFQVIGRQSLMGCFMRIYRTLETCRRGGLPTAPSIANGFHLPRR